MSDDARSRRDFLRWLGTAAGAAWLAAQWRTVAAAHASSRDAVQGHGADAARAPAERLEFFTPAEAADVEAIAAEIVPSDDTPGAREAGVVWFVDRSLRTWAAPGAAQFRRGLHEFQAAFAAAHGGRTFAAAAPAERIAWLRSVERGEFFAQMRLSTLLGMFSHPDYGGNRGGVGWQLLGFEDGHAFAPPFGWYDRDYPGYGRDPRP